jgi:hypothetical protein
MIDAIKSHPYLTIATVLTGGLALVGYWGYRLVRHLIDKCGTVAKTDEVAKKKLQEMSAEELKASFPDQRELEAKVAELVPGKTLKDAAPFMRLVIYDVPLRKSFLERAIKEEDVERVKSLYKGEHDDKIILEVIDLFIKHKLINDAFIALSSLSADADDRSDEFNLCKRYTVGPFEKIAFAMVQTDEWPLDKLQVVPTKLLQKVGYKLIDDWKQRHENDPYMGPYPFGLFHFFKDPKEQSRAGELILEALLKTPHTLFRESVTQILENFKTIPKDTALNYIERAKKALPGHDLDYLYITQNVSKRD